MNLSNKDLEQIKSLGIQAELVETQLNRFENGFPELKLCGNVNENQGLRKLSEGELKEYIELFDENTNDDKLVKFVPASGAASRMFQLLFNYLEGIVDNNDPGIQTFFNEIENFAFSKELEACFDGNFADLVKAKDKKIVDCLLSENGLNYGKLPKALLTFHKYSEENISKAIDEHLIEGANYCSDAAGNVNLHFTLSEEHIPLVKEHFAKAIPAYESKFNLTYKISFSMQDQATNTLAVDMENVPFRTEDGKLLFRPGGHGALLKNLNEIDADVIFVKNIDNVAANWLLQDTVNYKKALGGILQNTQQTIFNYCEQLDDENAFDANIEQEIKDFLENNLGFKLPANFSEKENANKIEFLKEKLNRPIRICGVVESKNTGGGPFWVKHSDGSETLQLVETDQVNKEDAGQVTLLQSSCYANITDLFCGVRNYKGEKFDLMKYRDPDTGFITKKSLNGKPLKAMELPGLWNGAMSNWSTCFVQVPMTTFNPVKTVLDLLKKEHQGNQ